MKLLCGNCLELMNDILDDSIDLIVTDPPYKMTSRGPNGLRGGMYSKGIVRSGKVFNYNDILPREYAKDFYRVLKDGGHCYVMTNHINLIDMLNSFTAVGFHFVKSLIWDKCFKIMGRFYMNQFEYILFFRKGVGIQINNCNTPDILSVPHDKLKQDDGSNYHDTAKPVKLMKILVENSSKEGEVVLDPFMGIGTTGIACKKLNRDFIGFEIDEYYFNIAKERIETGDYIDKTINKVRQQKLF